eukprot:13717094-Ditylum_brightwellii.AAC.1
MPAQYDQQDMMKGQGSLVHLCEVYPTIIPYLKGVHLTLESWHMDRDLEGWKYSKKQCLDILKELDPETEVIKEEDAPEQVNSVPSRLRNNLYALKELPQAEAPPLRLLRGVAVNQCTYGFVDASGQGFDSTFKTKDVQGI